VFSQIKDTADNTRACSMFHFRCMIFLFYSARFINLILLCVVLFQKTVWVFAPAFFTVLFPLHFHIILQTLSATREIMKCLLVLFLIFSVCEVPQVLASYSSLQFKNIYAGFWIVSLLPIIVCLFSDLLCCFNVVCTNYFIKKCYHFKK